MTEVRYRLLNLQRWVTKFPSNRRHQMNIIIIFIIDLVTKIKENDIRRTISRCESKYYHNWAESNTCIPKTFNKRTKPYLMHIPNARTLYYFFTFFGDKQTIKLLTEFNRKVLLIDTFRWQKYRKSYRM